jgi:C-terminal processing protease CtpA/Prc
MMLRIFTIKLLVVILVTTSQLSFADTVILKDGQKVKGLILDEYKDRVVVSTLYGERTLMKKDIRSAFYSSEEKALMQKASNHLRKGQQVEAYRTYSRVLELEPDNEQAKERLSYLKNSIESSVMSKLVKRTADKQDISSDDPNGGSYSSSGTYLGFSLAEGGKNAFVKEVDNTFFGVRDGRIKAGDRIVRAGGELTAFMDLEEVTRLLSAPGGVSMTIERDVFPELSSCRGIFARMPYISYKKVIGASLKLYSDGITVRGVVPGAPFDLAGIQDGDLVWRINGRNTRYMPTADVIGIIEGSRGETIELVIRRDITLWRKSEKR